MALRLAYSRDHLPIGATVKYSAAALRPAYEWYLSRGRPDEKDAAKRAHDLAASRRGRIAAIHRNDCGAMYYAVEWREQDTHGPYTSNTSPHLIEAAGPFVTAQMDAEGRRYEHEQGGR